MNRIIILSCLITFSCLFFPSCKRDDPINIDGGLVPYDLKTGFYWVLASTPQGQPGLFPNGNLSKDLQYNFGRAWLAWYTIDDLFYRNNTYTPKHIATDLDMLSKHRMREVSELEVFPNKQLPQGIPGTLRSFDLFYSPTTRGPYNYDFNSIDNDGLLINPASNWAGIMRNLAINDFEASNIEYIEFWLMDPYADYSSNQPNGGYIYLHIGDISEDILRDGHLSYENGFPYDEPTSEDNSIKTVWGYAPSSTPTSYVFNSNPESYKYQDIGYDGLSDEQEKDFHRDFLDNLAPRLNADVYQKIENDPSGDNYRFFRDSDYDDEEADIIERYKYYRSSEGNFLSPDVEDLNYDFTLDDTEAYYQYKIKINPNDDPFMQVGQNHITDKLIVSILLPNGTTDEVVWYQFKIPIKNYEKRIGTIMNFKSIRFMRLVMTQFEAPVVCRFARLQLVRVE